METKIIEKSEDSLDLLARMIREHKVGIFPCDTIYGLNALASEDTAERMYEIKRRQTSKNFLSLMSLEQLRNSSLEVPDFLYEIWPAPLTAILKDNKGGTRAVRVPADPFLQKLLPLTGAVYSTSVNFSGEKSLLSFSDIHPVFDGLVDYIVRDDSVEGGLPSTLIDCSAEEVRLIRQGAYDASSLIGRRLG